MRIEKLRQGCHCPMRQDDIRVHDQYVIGYDRRESFIQIVGKRVTSLSLQ